MDVGGQILGESDTTNGLFAAPSFRSHNNVASQFSEDADSQYIDTKMNRQSSFMEGVISTVSGKKKNSAPGSSPSQRANKDKETSVKTFKVPMKPALERARSIMGTVGYMGEWWRCECSCKICSLVHNL